MNNAAILSQQFMLVLPEILLILAACAIYLGGTFTQGRQLWAAVSLLTLLAAFLLLLESAGIRVTLLDVDYHLALAIGFDRVRTTPPDYIAPLVFDHLALLIKIVALVGGAVLVLISCKEVPDEHAAEYYASLLIVVAGLSLTGTANELVMLFLALELISIPTYVLLYLQRTDNEAKEAAAKYFLLSVFSAALLLFGFSYLYGLAGSTNLAAILSALKTGTEANRLPLLALVALVMVVGGLGFKITAVPFHFYAPDVYQGTTLPSAALLAFVPKVAGFVALLRLLGFVWPQGMAPGVALGSQAPVLFWILATMTMTVGNILALLQDNLKRMLAYSSVAHAGYMLIGLAVAPDLAGQPIVGGVEAVLFYLVSYCAMTLGAFAVLSYLNRPEHAVETVDDLAGVSQSQPGIALLFALFLFSLLGMPATAGFWGKFFLFFGAISIPADLHGPEHAQLFRWLAVIGAVNAAVGAWYYLRVISAMYLRTPIRPLELPRAWMGLVALWICAALTLGLGIYPQPLVQAARAVLGP